MNAKPKTPKAASAKAKKATTKITDQELQDIALSIVESIRESMENFEKIEVAFKNTDENFEQLEARTNNLRSSISLTDRLVDRLSGSVTVSARVSLAAIVLSVASIITTVILHGR